MIERQNWLDMRAYLSYCENIRQNAPESVNRFRSHLRHLLEWADDKLLPKSMQISPTFPSYLAGRALSPETIKKCLETVRHYFTFAHDRWPIRYKNIHLSWVDMLQPPRGLRTESRLHEHEFYSLDDVLALAAVQAETLRQERARIGACMLFLSGMRADALASLPVACVDMQKREVRQLPEMGVRTKNRKAAKTYLLDIPALTAVVESWDCRVQNLPPASLWYSPLTRDGMTIIPTSVAHLGRGDLLKRDLHIICRLANIRYLSPHKLRHGHVVYALKQARTMAELKAISQNVMHASLTITDQIYGKLLGDDVAHIIGNLGKTIQPATDDRLDEILRILRAGN